jgi:hypothetical protein
MQASFFPSGSGCLAAWAFFSAGIFAIFSFALSVRRKKHFCFSSLLSRPSLAKLFFP